MSAFHKSVKKNTHPDMLNSSMPVAMPVKPRRHRMQDTLLKEAIREERTVENLRRMHEFETFKSIIFQKTRGMSMRSLERIYGADTVRRCFETVNGGALAPRASA